MTGEQFLALEKFRSEYKSMCKKWSGLCPNLAESQKTAAKKDTPPYPLETPVVYNRSLEEISSADKIRLIVIGDNPGKDEQLAKNCRYLVGQAGKIAEGFFNKHPALKIDFRKNAIILNKTPIHTAKTHHLKFLQKNSQEAKGLILQSQIWLAKKTARLHAALAGGGNEDCELWLVGYAELKEQGIFTPYRDALLKEYEILAEEESKKKCCTAESEKKFDTVESGVSMNSNSRSQYFSAQNFSNEKATFAWEKVFVFQHFSMNRFLIDLKNFLQEKNCSHFDEGTLKENLRALGKKHRIEIFGK